MLDRIKYQIRNPDHIIEELILEHNQTGKGTTKEYWG